MEKRRLKAITCKECWEQVVVYEDYQGDAYCVDHTGIDKIKVYDPELYEYIMNKVND